MQPHLEEPRGSARAWTRSAFLHERTAPSAPAFDARAAAHAETRATRWQNGMLADDARFAARLALAGTDRGGLLRALAAPDEGEAAPAATAWLELAAELERQDGTEPLPALPGGIEGLPFHSFVVPFLRAATARLRQGVRRAGTPLDPAVESDMVVALAAALLEQSGQALTLEVNVARVLGELSGDTARERFRDFSARRFLRPGAHLDFLHEYPVLGRQLATTVAHWTAASLELVERLEADRETLSRAFGPIGRLVRARAGAGDAHRAGRTVVKLEFDSGLRLIYKPTSLAVDARYQELVRWFNGAGPRHELRTIAVLDRGEYGWIEFVEAAGCPDVEALERYYWRQGSVLALLHVLCSVDFHHENLIAAGEHPVPIDLEAIFHHTFPAGQVRPAEAELLRSVLQVGLLPFLSRGATGGINPDISGMGGEAGQEYAETAQELEDPLTDTMHVVRRRARTEESLNRPRLNESPVQAGAFTDHVARGFEESYDLLAARREELAERVKAFADVKVRQVLRHTRLYGLFLREAAHPDDLRDALDRDALLDRLWAEATVRPALARVVPSEQADLRQGDIPVFHARPGERHLWDARGTLIPDVFERSSLDEVLERIARMGPAERDRQSFLIRTATSVMSDAAPAAPIAPRRRPAPAAEMVEAAAAIGRHLQRRAFVAEGEACWVALEAETLVTNPDDSRRIVNLMRGDLYDGLAGIALFFAYLGRVTGDGGFTATAREALAGARRAVGRTRGVQLGAFVGNGGYAYLLHHLAVLWDDPALLDEALAGLPALEAAAAADEQLDVLGGAAGCAVVALGLHRSTGDERALSLARACGERLLATRQPHGGGTAWKVAAAPEPLPAFSHGTAGIAWALAELGAATGDARFHDAAREALAFERALFDPAAGHWGDPRLAWCHGAPSIALGRALTLGVLDDAQLPAELEAGIEATLRGGLIGSPCLCHGNAGNADILLTAGILGDRPEWREAAGRWGAAVLDELGGPALAALEGDAAEARLPRYAVSPGLMVGMAGIGMVLLRLAHPDAVPSVLAVQPPTHKRS